MIHKIEKRYNEDSQGYKKSMKSFMKSASEMMVQFKRHCLHLQKTLSLRMERGRNPLEFLYKAQLGREEHSSIEEEDLA